MFAIIRMAVDVVLFALVFSGGVKMNQKWPNAASYLTGVWNLVEGMFKWLYSLYTALHPSTTTK